MSDQYFPNGEPQRLGSFPANVLLVEDNFIIALDTEDMLRQLGVQSVWTAVSEAEAFEIIDRHSPVFALLDVNLGEEKGFEIAVRLRERGIRFAFGTGYGDRRAFPSEFLDVPVCTKPYRLEALAAILSGGRAMEKDV